MIFCTSKFPYLDKAMQETRMSRRDLSEKTGIKYDTLGYKLRNEAEFNRAEMRSIQKVLEAKAMSAGITKHYFLDQIFTTSSEMSEKVS